jgi:hypothetical protein
MPVSPAAITAELWDWEDFSSRILPTINSSENSLIGNSDERFEIIARAEAEALLMTGISEAALPTTEWFSAGCRERRIVVHLESKIQIEFRVAIGSIDLLLC